MNYLLTEKNTIYLKNVNVHCLSAPDPDVDIFFTLKIMNENPAYFLKLLCLVQINDNG